MDNRVIAGIYKVKSILIPEAAPLLGGMDLKDAMADAMKVAIKQIMSLNHRVTSMDICIVTGAGQVEGRIGKGFVCDEWQEWIYLDVPADWIWYLGFDQVHIRSIGFMAYHPGSGDDCVYPKDVRLSLNFVTPSGKVREVRCLPWHDWAYWGSDFEYGEPKGE